MIMRSPNWEWLRALWSRAWMTDPKRAMAIVSRDISPKDEHGNRQDTAAIATLAAIMTLTGAGCVLVKVRAAKHADGWHVND